MTDQPNLFDLAADSAAAYLTTSEVAVAAAQAVQRAEDALLKWISPNDARVTGSHQYGFLIPRSAWPIFFERPGEDGENLDNDGIEVDWFDHGVTESRAIWYGSGTRAEYRLTRLGRNFPFQGEEHVGSLLVITPLEPLRRYRAFVLADDESITEFLAALGLTQADVGGRIARREPVDVCFRRWIDDLLGRHPDFPTTLRMAMYARQIGEDCRGLTAKDPDRALVQWTEVEFRLFREFEDRAFRRELDNGPISDIDRLIDLALPFTNRRKARAGRSFEHHFAACLDHAGIPYGAQAETEQGNTIDFAFPSAEAYADLSFPSDRLVVCGAKTSAKERWRQVLEEADRVPVKHLLTLQPVAPSTVQQMVERGIQLVVPRSRQREFGEAARPALWTVEQFLSHTSATVMP